ncbi:PilT/PilU family type 4a pilus ATPase, partial [bacterium]|nr:PilT/PilU family type 4a pilus ATPase [bacterium]
MTQETPGEVPRSNWRSKPPPAAPPSRPMSRRIRASQVGKAAEPVAAAATPTETLKPFEQILAVMGQYSASDLHLKVGCAPVLRISGIMRPLAAAPLTGEDIHRLLLDVATPDTMKTFERKGDVDFAHALPDRQRFRLNAFRDKRAISIAVRRINMTIPRFSELNLPEQTFQKIARFEDGIVLFAGITGCGKSTSIASMIDYLNETEARHIITVEDPVEFEFQNKKSYISQREIGIDCLDFKSALKSIVRQDPDVILMGEMRDEETFEFGLSAAETGHLVFATLHAGNVAQSIGRILGLFAPEKHSTLRHGLEFNLRAIICQKLLPSINPSFLRVPVLEVMIVNAIIKKLLREGEDGKIPQVIQGCRTEGMMTFNQSLCERVKSGLIAEHVALE